MKVQVWRSFAANNSSSYYLVARFAAPDQAALCAAELSDYVTANEAERAAMSERERRANAGLTMANLELADRLGLGEWPTYIAQGHADDAELEIATLGSELIVYHDDCLGFDPALSDYLARRGATIGSDGWNRQPTLSILVFPATPDDRALLAELAELLGADLLAGFDAPSVAGYTAAVGVDQLDSITALLDRHPRADVEVAADRPGDEARFRHIATARCPECDAHPLDYLRAGRAPVPEDQLACSSCGGMFALAG